MFNFLFDKSFSSVKVHGEILINTAFTPNSVGAFLINLDRATDRLKFVKPCIDQLGFPVERISAVDGRLLPEDEIQKVCNLNTYKKYFKMLPELGTIGCSLSHEKALRQFLDSEYEFALILEDDVVFNSQELKACVENSIEKKELWDVLIFEMLHDGLPIKVGDLYSDKHLSLYLTTVTHSGCYLVNRNAAKKLLEKFFPIIMPFDHYFSAAWEFDLKFVGVEPRIVKQNFGSSQIKCERVEKFNDLKTKISNAVFSVRRSIVHFLYNSYLVLQNLVNH